MNLRYFEFEMSMGHAGGQFYTELDTSQMRSYQHTRKSWTEHTQKPPEGVEDKVQGKTLSSTAWKTDTRGT